MSSIELWLGEHDLADYIGAFVENDIKLGDLPDLTAQDLVEIGLPVGPRRRTLRAIREMVTRDEETTPASIEPAAAAGHGDHMDWARRPDDRRPITLPFADVTQSTAFTELLDREDAHAVLSGAVRRIGEAVEAHRGPYADSWVMG